MHADGEDEEYIKKAIAEGVKILGFSDHAPYIYPAEYTSYYKMTPDGAAEYFSSLKKLQNKYRDRIQIYIGYEAEYYADLWQDTFDFWRAENSPEYLILGQHYVGGEYSAEGKETTHSMDGTDRKDLLTKYVDEVIEAINTKKFTYIAHPDLFNFTGDDDFYREEARRLILEAQKLDIPLEINLLGMRFCRSYPTPLFWEVASQHNPKVILGCDAHQPERIADKNELTQALLFADKYKLNVIEELKLINPFK
jgi:histidinol-phosphatase (PHP family)